MIGIAQQNFFNAKLSRFINLQQDKVSICKKITLLWCKFAEANLYSRHYFIKLHCCYPYSCLGLFMV